MEGYRILLGIIIWINGLYAQNIGYFWHVSDMHWDPTYQRHTQALSCNPGTSGSEFGKYGDYRCDPPWELLNSSVYAMRNIKSDVDFLIWTGDDTPHIWNDTILHKQAVSDIVTAQTNLLLEVFPDKTVYSALGNHDYSPKHQLPPHPDPFYEELAAKWHPWMDAKANETFKKAAYYTMPYSQNLRIVVLNTNLYYTSNALTESMPDPANQLQWLDELLTQSNTDSQKVILVAHVPPGMFEKHRNKYWFYPFYNEVFLALLKKHAATIGAIHMAHHHTDSFRIVYDDQGTPVGSMFLAPSVTPWETTLPDVMGGLGNNPSIRLIQYNRDTGETLNIHQYYLNLNTANDLQQADWVLEYNATGYYGVPDLSSASLHQIVQQMETNDELFSLYYKANGVLYDPDEKWTEDIRTVHICAIRNIDYEEYGNCIDPPVVDSAIPVQSCVSFSLVLLSVILFTLKNLLL